MTVPLINSLKALRGKGFAKKCPAPNSQGQLQDNLKSYTRRGFQPETVHCPSILLYLKRDNKGGKGVQVAVAVTAEKTCVYARGVGNRVSRTVCTKALPRIGFSWTVRGTIVPVNWAIAPASGYLLS